MFFQSLPSNLSWSTWFRLQLSGPRAIKKSLWGLLSLQVLRTRLYKRPRQTASRTSGSWPWLARSSDTSISKFKNINERLPLLLFLLKLLFHFDSQTISFRSCETGYVEFLSKRVFQNKNDFKTSFWCLPYAWPQSVKDRGSGQSSWHRSWHGSTATRYFQLFNCS